MPGTETYHTPHGNTPPIGRFEPTPIEWRREAAGQWHRVRVVNDTTLCERPMAAATQRQDLDSPPPESARCKGCERFWPIFQWAVERTRD